MRWPQLILVGFGPLLRYASSLPQRPFGSKHMIWLIDFDTDLGTVNGQYQDSMDMVTMLNVRRSWSRRRRWSHAQQQLQLQQLQC